MKLKSWEKGSDYYIFSQIPPAIFVLSEAVYGRCSVKEVFLEISQNSQECKIPKFKIRKISKFLRTSFLTEHLRRLLLHFLYLFLKGPQPAFTCSKLTIETLEQGVKYVQS